MLVSNTETGMLDGMHPCCPAGRGCNSADRDEACVLTLFRAFAADEPAAALALARWEVFEDACRHHPVSDGEQRFRRRAYERARERALAGITMCTTSRLIDSQANRRRRRSPRVRSPRTGRPANRAWSIQTVSERELELPRASQASGLARNALAQWYGGSLDKEELDAGKLLASELVTNAVMHGVGRIRLHADLDEDRLVIEVMDEGSGFEYLVRKVPFDQLHNRGLALVDAVSSRSGIHDGTTHVWAEVERTGSQLGARK
jgi:hypothetical protein